jgi:hypothetical protein
MTRKESKAVYLDRLVGRWSACDEWATDVSLIVSKRGGKLRVRALDQPDGEDAEVYDLRITSRGLSFAAYWSSGQFTKYQLRPLGSGQLEAIFTFTDTTMFKKVSPKR